MNLLEKATTITTATAYDNGKLHSVKGGSVADFDVVRGSLATRVNAEGLIEDISTLSGELVTNGGFDTDSDWTLGTGVIIANSKLTKNDPSVGNTSASQGAVLTVGKTYKYKLVVSGNLTASDKVVVFSTDFTSDGTYEGYFTANSTSLVFSLRGSTNVYSIDNISVVEVIDATNIPRLDYTDGTASILLEPQSTNLVTDSEDYSQWTPTGVSVTPNSTTSPDGLINGTLLSTNGGTSSRLLRNFGLPTSATIKVLSVYAKANLSNFIQLPLSGDAQSYVNFDVSNGVVGTSGTKSTGEIQSVGNGWYRCIAYFDSTTIFGTSSFIALTTSNSSGYGGAATSDSLSAYIWGSQYEELPHATSYIPTSGAIATRLADVVTGAGDASTFNSSEGVLYFEASRLSDVGTCQLGVFGSSSSEQLRIEFNNSSIRAQLYNGSFQVNISSTQVVTDMNKVAFKYKENDHALWINGVEVLTDNSGVTFNADELIKLNLSNGTGAIPFYGKVKALAVFNEALTDSELECLTTI